jgi:general secretion pathway protein J
MKSRWPAGFTLLEVIAALVVLGFLMIGLSQGVHFGLSAWGTQARIMAARDDLDAADRTLRHLVQEMDPGTQRDPPQIEGDGSRLLFTSRLPVAVGGEMADMLLTAAPGGQLVLRWTPHLHARRIGPQPVPKTEVLLPGVERLAIAYWRPARMGGGWVSNWTQHEIPALVRFRIVFPPGSHRQWPDIVAAPIRSDLQHP